MKCLVVIAHPIHDSLCRALAQHAISTLTAHGHDILRQPVKRVLKTALLGTCAPQCRFGMLSLYQAESLSPDKVQTFRARIGRTLSKWA